MLCACLCLAEKNISQGVHKRLRTQCHQNKSSCITNLIICSVTVYDSLMDGSSNFILNSRCVNVCQQHIDSVTGCVCYLGHKQGPGVNDVEDVSHPAEEGALEETAWHRFNEGSFTAVWEDQIRRIKHAKTLLWLLKNYTYVFIMLNSLLFYIQYKHGHRQNFWNVLSHNRKWIMYSNEPIYIYIYILSGYFDVPENWSIKISKHNQLSKVTK